MATFYREYGIHFVAGSNARGKTWCSKNDRSNCCNGVVNYVFFWNSALCGASGVVFAFILMSSFTSFREGEIPITFILVAVIYLGQQIYEGIVLQDNISNMAHILGGVVGGILGFSLNKKSKYGI